MPSYPCARISDQALGGHSVYDYLKFIYTFCYLSRSGIHVWSKPMGMRVLEVQRHTYIVKKIRYCGSLLNSP